MQPVDALWHVLNFFAPAVGVGVLAPLFAKLVWRKALNGARWIHLCTWATSSACATLVVGMIVFGHDGKMATYLSMLATCSIALWWVGFGRQRG